MKIRLMGTEVKTFGDRLRILRKNKNFTQEQLANLLNVNRITIVKWEKGTSEPKISVLRHLAFWLGVEINYLLEEDELLRKRSERPY